MNTKQRRIRGSTSRIRHRGVPCGMTGSKNTKITQGKLPLCVPTNSARWSFATGACRLRLNASSTMLVSTQNELVTRYQKYSALYNCKSRSCFSSYYHFPGLRKVMVRAHRQAWCWQDEWYGLTMEDIRQLELETQLALAMKMAQFSQAEEATEANGAAPSPDKNEEVKEAISSIEAEEVVVSSGETLKPRGVLTKQWSTSSRSSRSSKRGGEEQHFLTHSALLSLYAHIKNIIETLILYVHI